MKKLTTMNKMYRITLVILVMFFFLGCRKKSSTSSVPTCDAVQGDWELVE